MAFEITQENEDKKEFLAFEEYVEHLVLRKLTAFARDMFIAKSENNSEKEVQLLKELYQEIEEQDISERIKGYKAVRLFSVAYLKGIRGLEDIKNKVEEWDREPDELRFTDEETGYECVIKRGRVGQLNGYVVIPESHPRYKTTIDDNADLLVHGGVTWSDFLDKEDEFLIGFDCAHAWDFWPYDNIDKNGSSYKNIEYVKKECESLAFEVKWKELINDIFSSNVKNDLEMVAVRLKMAEFIELSKKREKKYEQTEK